MQWYDFICPDLPVCCVDYDPLSRFGQMHETIRITSTAKMPAGRVRTECKTKPSRAPRSPLMNVLVLGLGFFFVMGGQCWSGSAMAMIPYLAFNTARAQYVQ